MAKHWILYAQDGHVALVSEDEADVREEVEEFPGSHVLECDCSTPAAHSHFDKELGGGDDETEH